MQGYLAVAARWLSGEPVLVRSRRRYVLLLGLSLLVYGYAWKTCSSMTQNLTHAKPPPLLPLPQGDERFGVPLRTRKEIFAELAVAEPTARAEGKRSFPGEELAWSADDHRGAFERKTVASLMAMHRLSMTHIYLILDEGIREHWLGPDGKPLLPTTTPLHPRRKYGW